MRILITGGAGYIGAHIVDLLCDKNYNVIVFDNLSSGFQENLNEKSIFFKGDLTKMDDLDYIFKKYKIDSIIHMAAYKSVEDSMINSEIYTNNNIIGSINLISAAIKYGVNKFIFSSTAAIYGNLNNSPIDETASPNPINHYGFTKLYIEQYLDWISNINDIRFVCLRYFNAAGYTEKNDLIKFKEKEPSNLLPIVMEVANGTRNQINIYGSDYNTKDGTCIRDYIHVIDLATAHIKAIDYLSSNKRLIVNLSTGRGYSVLDVIKIAEKITSQEIKYKFVNRRLGDPAELISNTTRSKKELKWFAKFSDMEKIIESMWKIYSK